jgi:hypothetical protein
MSHSVVFFSCRRMIYNTPFLQHSDREGLPEAGCCLRWPEARLGSQVQEG